MSAWRLPLEGKFRSSGAERLLALLCWGVLLCPAAGPAAAQTPETLAAIESAESYLLARLSEPSSAPTTPPLFDRDAAVALRALAEGGRTDPPVATAFVRLAGAPLTTAEPAALRALALAAAGAPAPPLSELGTFANGSGMGAVAGHHSNLFDTSLVVEALALEEAARLVELADLVSWLTANRNPDGGWGFVPGDASSVYATARVLLALGRLEQLAVDPAAIAAAQSFLASRQEADGGFGATPETALAWRALLASGFDPASLAASPAATLVARQLPDGSFDGDLFVTAQALLALRLDLPNLTVPEAVADPESVAGGGALRVDVTILNQGPAAAPSTRLALLSEAVGEPLGSATVPALAAGEEAVLEVQVVVPAGSGELSLVALADADEEVAERSESDNRRALRVDLVLPADLAVFASDLAISPPRPVPGELASLVAAVRNLGEEEIGLFSYQVTEVSDGVAANLLAEGTAGPASPGAGVVLEVPLSLPEGEHHLRLELDPEDSIAEGSETNNRAETMLLVADDRLPDLAVEAADVTASPERPAVGETVTVEAIVANLGSVEASARVELLEGTGSGEGRLLAEKSVTLAAGGSTLVTASFAAGAETVAVTVALDPEGAVVELSEANNRARRFLVDLPDPAIGFDHLDLVPAEPLAGETVAGTLTVRNAGSLAAPVVPVAVFAGDPEAGGAEIFRGEVLDVAPGGNRSLTFSWTAVGGRTAVTAVADPAGLVEELSETNNRQVREVVVPRATGADLAVEAVDLSAYAQDPNGLAASGTVGLTIGNAGNAETAGETSVRLFEDVDGDLRFGGPDRLLATAVVPALAAGASAEVGLPVDADLAFHRPLLVAELDPSDLVAERDESDNRVAVLVECEEPPVTASLEPFLEWSVGDFEVESTPVVVQLTDDTGDGLVDGRDVPDVAFHAEDGGGPVVVALSGADGARLWTFRSSLAHPLASRLAHLAAGDLDGDGVAELVAVQRDGRLLALDRRGRPLWTSDRIGSIGGFQWAGGAALGDLTGDGAPEIALGRAVVSNRGELLAVGTGNVGRAANAFGPFGAPFLVDVPLSVIADVDLDGRNELVAGDTLYRMEAGRLEIVWDHEVEDLLMIDGLTAVAQLDSDPEAEIVYVSSGWALVLEHDGTVASGPRRIFPVVGGVLPSLWGGPPSVSDLDGDGRAEILVVGRGELAALRGDLSELWRVPTTETSELTAAVAFDLDADGTAEVLTLDETTFRILAGPTGATLHSRPNLSKTGSESPVVADVDGDGAAEVLVPSNTSFAGDRSTRGLHLLGNPTWRPTAGIWNQHSHHGTNVLADGTIPSTEPSGWLVLGNYRSNRELARTPTFAPNLTLGLPRVGAVETGGVPVTVRVGNGGLGRVGAGVEVALFEAETAGTEPVATATTSRALAPGEWEDVTLSWQAAGTSGAPALARVDAGGTVAECDETDNELAFVITETVLADLTIPAGGVTASPTALAGALVPVGVTVTNAGGAAAGSFVVRLYDGDPGTGEPVDEATAPGLEAGASLEVALAWDSRGETGVHRLHAVADAEARIVEVSEDDNTGLAEVSLTPASLPDLSVETLSAEPAAVTAGTSVRVTAGLVNRGTALETGIRVAFLAEGAEVGRVEVPERLAAGEERTVELLLDTAALAGTILVEAVADPDGAVAEEDETNNRAAGELEVGAPVLSASVASDRFAYEPGETALFTVRVEAGSGSGAASLWLDVVDSAGGVVASLAEALPLDLAAGSAEASFGWAIGSALPGVYSGVVRVTADEDAGATARTAVSVARRVELSADLFADRDLYPPGLPAILTARVESTSGNAGLTHAPARFSIADATGVEVFAEESPVASILPGGRITRQAVWETSGVAAGSFTARFELRDAFGVLVAFDETRIGVEASDATGAGLSGSLLLAPEEAGIGALLDARFTVSNLGSSDLPDLEMAVAVVDPADGRKLAGREVLLPLARGASGASGVGLPTEGLLPGSYVAVLVARLPGPPGSGGVEVALDRQTVRLVRGVSIADAADAEGDAGETELRFAVRLEPPAGEPVTVSFATADGTALAGEDYLPVSGTLGFAPGESLAEIAVPVVGDLATEPAEAFLVVLGDAAGAALGDGVAVGEISDEEGCSSPQLLADGGFESAAGSAWSDPAGVSVPAAGAPPPLAGEAARRLLLVADGTGELLQEVDLAAFGAAADAGSLELAAELFHRTSGAGSGRLVVEALDAAGATPLAVLDTGAAAPAPAGSWSALTVREPLPVGTRRLVVRFEASSPGAAGEVLVDRASLVVLGVPVLTVGDVEVAEGDDGTSAAVFPVALSCPSAVPVTLELATVAGSAAAGADFTPLAESRTLAAGELATEVAVEVLGDRLDEEDETFALEASSSEPGLVLLEPRGEATVRDDDGEVVASAVALTVAEGDAARTVEVAVRLSAPSGRQVSVEVATADGTAVAGEDYEAASAVLAFAPGTVEASFAVRVVGDGVHEGDETLTVGVVAATNAQAGPAGVLTLADDDPVDVSVADVRVLEGDAGASLVSVPVVLSNPSRFETRVDYSTRDVEATAGLDYEAAAGTLVVAPGAIEAAIEVSIVGDVELEGTERFAVVLAHPVGGGLGDPEGTVRILDDDGVLVSVGDVTVTEAAGEVVFPVTLSRPSETGLTVSYATAELEARVGEDFAGAAGSLSIPAGSVAGEVRVPLVDDAVGEPVERFRLVLSAPSEGGLLDPEGEATVVDDDVWALDGLAEGISAPGCFVLTPASKDSQASGAIWRPEFLDLSASFDKTFQVVLGDRELGRWGLSFNLHRAGLVGVPLRGAGTVFAGPSVAVEVDTSNSNSPDPNEDHLAVNLNGSELHNGHKAVFAVPDGRNIEDGAEHLLRVTWNAGQNQLGAYFDDLRRLLMDRDVVASPFGGDPLVTWGIGAMGSARHVVCEVDACLGSDEAPAISIGDVRVSEGDGGGVTTASFAVTLSCPAEHPVTVAFATEDGTAVAGEDYTATAGTVTFAPGETSQGVSVEIAADDAGEADESFFVQLAEASGGVLRSSRAEGVIQSDDLLFHLPSPRILEGDEGTIAIALPVELERSIGRSVDLDYTLRDGTARAGEDYVASSGRLNLIQRGNFKLAILGDREIEGDEDFFIDVVPDPPFAPASLRVVIADDECTGVELVRNGSAEDVDLGRPRYWTDPTGRDRWRGLLRSDAPDGERVFWSGQVGVGLLEQDVDLSPFAAAIDAGEVELGFEAWGTERLTDFPEYEVDYLDETGTLIERVESFRMPRGWHRTSDVRTPPSGSRTARIRLRSRRRAGSSNDALFDAVSLRILDGGNLAVADAEIPEGDSGSRTLRFDVTLACSPEATVAVDYLTVDGTATAGSDYRAAGGTLLFPPGTASLPVDVEVFGDTREEGDETFTLRLVNPQGALLADDAAVGSILEDETRVSLAGTSLLEGDEGTAEAVFPVTLSAPSTLPVAITFATSDGSAVAGEDYVAAEGTLTIEPGELSAEIRVAVVGDREVEPDESFTVTLVEIDNAVVEAGASSAGGTIFNDDLTISVGDARAREGDAGTTTRMRFPVRLSVPSLLEVQVSYSTLDGTAVAGEDYTAASGVLVFAPGTIEQEIVVDVTGDDEVEVSEHFFVVLSDPIAASLLDADGLGVVGDDDDCTSVNLVANPGAEQGEVDGVLRGWREVVGASWRQRTTSPSPLEGSAYFFPATGANPELAQDVDLAVFAEPVDRGVQRFVFSGFLRSRDGDAARVLLEYLGAGGEVLAAFDSGEVVDTTAWRQVSDLRAVPPGTRSARVRLLCRRVAGSDCDGIFDGLSLASLGVPTVSADPVVHPEGDDGTSELVFDVGLSCPEAAPVTVAFATAPVDAVAEVDYLPTSGSLTLPVGMVAAPVAVPVVGDRFDEIDGRFELVLSTADSILVTPRVEATIADDDPPPFLVVDTVEVFEGPAGESHVVHVPIRLSRPSRKEVLVTYHSSALSATAGEDYVHVSSVTRSFRPEETEKLIPVTILGDDLAEPDESFALLFLNERNSSLATEGSRVHIQDDDGPCEGPDLHVNGGGEDGPVGAPVPGWSLGEGAAPAPWTRGGLSPPPFAGFGFLAAPDEAASELVQEVDLTAFAAPIDLGSQSFRVSGRLRVGGTSPLDAGRIVVEYVGAGGEVLGAFDSGLLTPTSWQLLTDERPAPAGTRNLRVRLVSERRGGTTTEVYFDALELEPRGTPVLSARDVATPEGGGISGTAELDLRLSCPLASDLAVAYETVDATAEAGLDYVASSGTVVLPAGSGGAKIAIPLVDDAEVDPGESFEVLLSTAGTGVSVATPRPRIDLVDDDGVALDLALCLDMSGSISLADWRLQLEGTAAAIEDPAIVPHNDSVRLSVLKFGSEVFYNVPPVVIGEANAQRIANGIRGLTSRGGGTNTHACISRVWPVIVGAAPSSAKQVIDVSTDGAPNIFSATRLAADRAMEGGVDAINAIGVGSISLAGLEAPVRPLPVGGTDGFVLLADSFDEYAAAIAEKIRREVTPDLFVAVDDGRASAIPGERLVYEVTVGNRGSGAVAGVRVVPELPADLLDPVFAVERGVLDEATGAWSGLTLTTGETVSLTITGTVSLETVGELVLAVTVLPPEGVDDLEPADNRGVDTTLVEGRADLALAKSHEGAFRAGGEGRYRLVASNLGPGVAAAPITVVDTLPAGLVAASAAGEGWVCEPAAGSEVRCSRSEPLAVGASAPPIELAVTVAPEASAELVNGATVASPTPDPVPANDTASDPTSIVRPELSATKTAHLGADADGDGHPSPGDTLRYTVTVASTGTASVAGVVLRDAIPEHTTLVPGSIATTAGTVTSEDPVEVAMGELAAGLSVTVTFEVSIDLPVAAGVEEIVNQGTVTSADLPAVPTDDPALAGEADPTRTSIVAAPSLVAEKTAALVVDADGDGVASAGDTLEYRIGVVNRGNRAATAVTVSDPVPLHTALVAGSVTAGQGTIDSEDPVIVTLGEIAPGAQAEVRFRVVIEASLDAGVEVVSNQATVTSAELADLLSDDPSLGGDADPTVTPVTGKPRLTVEKTDLLFTDADADGGPSPGDELLYRIVVAGSGNTDATGVELTDSVPLDTALSPGTLQTSRGTAFEEVPLRVAFGDLPAGSEAVVTFRVRVDEEVEVETVSNQATVTSVELEPVASDDPGTREPADPTVTEVLVTPDVSIAGSTVGEEAGPARFPVTLSRPTRREVRVSWETRPGTAAAEADYVPASGVLAVPAGTVAGEISVELVDDALDEPEEGFVVVLTGIENGLVVAAEAEARIVDDDPPPSVTVVDASGLEGDQGESLLSVPVVLSGPSGFEIVVTLATREATATAGVDYLAAGGSLVLVPGATATELAIPVLGDRIDEDEETILVEITGVTRATIADGEAVARIEDDDTALLSIGDVTVDEGDEGPLPALFPVRLSLPRDREARVGYETLEESATAGSDFEPASGTLIFPTGDTAATISVDVLGDRFLEADEETFSVELVSPVAVEIDDGRGVGTIRDDELCPGPNLLVNPGAEERPVSGELPGWTEVEGTSWTWRRFLEPLAFEGVAHFFAGAEPSAELAQEVDVSVFAPSIDTGGQAFAFAGRVRSLAEAPEDVALLVVEYVDAGGVVLDAFDSGEIASPLEWLGVEDVRTAPAGTRSIRVRLLATRFTGEDNDAYFDALELRPLRSRVLSVGDVEVFEGDSGTTDAVFPLTLACLLDREVTVSFATADGTATAGEDYLATSGEVRFAIGETEKAVAVAVLGDEEREGRESFELVVSPAAGSDLVLPRTSGVGTIVEALCPRSPGFWKTHEDVWPDEYLVVGGVVYDAAGIAELLRGRGKDASAILARQLVATRFNLLSGSHPSILPVVEAADAFLAAHPPGSDPRGEAREEALTYKDALDAYNNRPCTAEQEEIGASAARPPLEE